MSNVLINTSTGMSKNGDTNNNDRNLIIDIPFDTVSSETNGRVYTLNATSLNLGDYDNFGTGIVDELVGWTFRCGGYGCELAGPGVEEEIPEIDAEGSSAPEGEIEDNSVIDDIYAEEVEADALEGFLPIPSNWKDKKESVKLLIDTYRGEIAVDEIRTASGVVLKDDNFREESVYTLMLVKDDITSVVYQAICLSEAPFNIGNNVIDIRNGGTGNGDFPTKDGTQVAFPQLPINSLNPNKFYPYSYTCSIAKEYPLYDQPINLTQEDLDNLVFPTDDSHWLVEQKMWISNHNSSNIAPYYRFLQYWYLEDYSRCFKRMFAGYPTVDGSDLNWSTFEKIYNKPNQPYATNGLITSLDQLDDVNLAPGIYECFLIDGYNEFPIIGRSRHFMMIIGRHTTNDIVSTETGIGWAQQIAIPFDNSIYRGVFYRLANSFQFNKWQPIDYKLTISTTTTLNSKDLPNGVYECNIPNYTGINGGVNQHFMLINTKYSSGDLRTQLAIPFSNQNRIGVWYRIIQESNTATHSWTPVGDVIINRNTPVNHADTSYDKVMARGISMSSSVPNNITNGAIHLVYS